MELSIQTISEASAGIIAVIGGAYTVTRGLIAGSKRKKELYKQDILSQAKEQANCIREDLEKKITALENEFEAQKELVSKDFSHFREIHNAEIKVLGEKIENLRQDLSDQHQSIVALLTKLVDSR